MRHLLVTGCDAAHFDLAEDLITSIRRVSGRAYPIGFIRLCATPLPAAIAGQVDFIVDHSAGHDSFDTKSGYFAAYSGAKPAIPQLFPGFDLYTWIDADCWLQNDITLRKVEIASANADICIHPMLDIHYFRYPMPSDRTMAIYSGAAPVGFDRELMRLPMMNSGVFSMKPSSSIWGQWQAALANLRTRNLLGDAVYFSDEVAVNYLLRTGNFNIFPLRAIDNWQTYACAPNLDLETGKLVVPTFPFEPLSIIHLAGTTKDELYNVGLAKKIRLRYRELNAALQAHARMRTK